MPLDGQTVLHRTDIEESFGLEAKIEEDYSEPWGALAVLWVDLYNIRAEGLQRYGEVASRLDDLLDPSLMRLGHFTHELMGVLRPIKESSVA